MKKFIIAFIVLIIIFILIFFNYKNKNITKQNTQTISDTQNDTISNEGNVNEVTININGNEYILSLEDNETAKEFTNILPLDITMQDLNDNEKYYNLASPLLSNDYAVGTIKKGDVMLYNSDTLVIFYKDFDTSYKYTKIGFIENLDENDLANIDEIQVNIK